MEKQRFIKDILPIREKLIIHARRILKSEEEAEDVVQEVYLKLWSIRDRLSQYNNLEALSVTVTKNLCFNKLRANREVLTSVDNSAIMYESHTPHARLAEKDDVEQVMKIIGQLPNLQQAIIKMKHIEGMEINEIAELTGSNPEAIRTNLSRARKRVKEAFIKIQKV